VTSTALQSRKWQLIGMSQWWLPVSCRSSAGQGKFAGQRPTFYHCATEPIGTSRKPVCDSLLTGYIFTVCEISRQKLWKLPFNFPVSFNTLECRCDYIATSNNMTWSWYTGRWWVGCYIWYSEEETERGRSPPRPLLVVPNVTAHSSTASVPITLLLYNGPLLCGFSVAMKGLKVSPGVISWGLCNEIWYQNTSVISYHIISY